MTDLAGARVLITGAASGLGRRLALESAGRQAALVLWDRNREGLERVVSEVRGLGATVEGTVLDVSRREEVYEAAGRAGQPVDVLINNAGVVSGKRLLENPDELIERTFAVNTLPLFWTVKAFLPGMIDRGRGHVVTIASAAGLIGVPRLTDYCASKWAAVGFDESLRAELRRVAPAIRTTVVCPYYIRTGLFEGAKSRFPLLLPLLDEEKVARRIVRGIARNERKLVMPALVRTIPWVRLLPISWFDAVAEILGINASMDEFRGRSGRT
jgi:all-trans-retinol dehydrogenase (NAD+)